MPENKKSKIAEEAKWPPIQPEGREPTVLDIAHHILNRLQEDRTADDAELMMVHRREGAFRRVLFDELGKPPSGEKWFYDPSYKLTGARLRALCEAIINQ